MPFTTNLALPVASGMQTFVGMDKEWSEASCGTAHQSAVSLIFVPMGSSVTTRFKTTTPAGHPLAHLHLPESPCPTL